MPGVSFKTLNSASPIRPDDLRKRQYITVSETDLLDDGIDQYLGVSRAPDLHFEMAIVMR
jgi:hypothetical protein